MNLKEYHSSIGGGSVVEVEVGYLKILKVVWFQFKFNVRNNWSYPLTGVILPLLRVLFTPKNYGVYITQYIGMFNL